MSRALANQMRIQAALQAGQRVVKKLGTVSSFDPSTYSAKVLLQPEETPTGWLPIGSVAIGNGWGIFTPPSQGDQVSVEFVEGDIESGVVGLRLYSDTQRPLPAQSGEIWLVSKDGVKVQLLAGGTLHFEASAITSSGPWTHTGNLNVTGDVHATGTVTGDTDVVAAGISGKGHHHGGVKAGTDNSGGPQ